MSITSLGGTSPFQEQAKLRVLLIKHIGMILDKELACLQQEEEKWTATIKSEKEKETRILS